MALDLGDYKHSYCCYNLDTEIRKKSSSGGVFYELASYVLECGGVVCGAAVDENKEVTHRIVDRIEEIELLQGSKYVQSKIGNCFKQIKQVLAEGKIALFVGTPCQVAGIRNYLGENENLLLVDVICHGAPSPLVWEKYLKETIGNEKVQQVNFRDKSTGWENYSFYLKTERRTVKHKAFDDIYMKSFLKNYSLRPACYRCDIKQENIQSDLTLGDFWGVDEQKEHMNDHLGTSVVFTNTLQGRRYWEKIQQRFVWENFDATILKRTNPSIAEASTCPQKREQFFKMLQKDRTLYRSYTYCENGPIIKRIGRKIKHLIKRG